MRFSSWSKPCQCRMRGRCRYGWRAAPFQQTLVARLPPPSMLFEAVTGDQGQLVLPAILGFTQGIGSVVSGVLVILFLSLYWSINQIHFERLWLSLLPSGQRKQARDIWRTIEPDIGAYIRGQVIQSLLAGLLLGLGYWLLGSPYPALLALAGALACLIPVVGPALAVIHRLLVGLLTSVQLSLFTTLYALVVLIALGVWVKPRLFNRRWDNPISDRCAAHCHGRRFWSCRHHHSAAFIRCMPNPVEPPGQPPRWFQGLRPRFQTSKSGKRVWDTIRAMDEPPLPLVTSSMERLTHLIEKAEPVLQAALPAAVLSADLSEPFQPSQPITVESGPPVFIEP